MEREHIVATKALPRGEELRIYFEASRGRTYFVARKFYIDPADGVLKHGKGLRVDARDLPWLTKQLDVALQAALEEGLLCEEDYELANLPIPVAMLGGKDRAA